MGETPKPGSESAPPLQAAPANSKRARILERTLFGGGLALICAGMLWLVNWIGNATPVLFVGALISLFGLIEASLMGTLLMRALPVILIVPLIGVTAIEFACIQRPPSTRPWTQLVLEVVVAASLAVLAHALTRVLSRRTLARPILILILCAALTGGVAWLDNLTLGPLDALPAFGVLTAAALLVAVLANRSAGRRKDLLIAVGLAVWIAVPLPAVAQVARLWEAKGLVSLILLSKIGDVAGYYVGNAIGRRHPFPRLSPGKTVAGCVGSFVVALLAGAALALSGLLPPGPLGVAGGLLAGACINLASQAGDLFESWVKRCARVKDSSTWLGPSGGILDVVDSLLFSVPAALLVWPLLFHA